MSLQSCIKHETFPNNGLLLCTITLIPFPKIVECTNSITPKSISHWRNASVVSRLDWPIRVARSHGPITHGSWEHSLFHATLDASALVSEYTSFPLWEPCPWHRKKCASATLPHHKDDFVTMAKNSITHTLHSQHCDQVVSQWWLCAATVSLVGWEPCKVSIHIKIVIYV